MTALDRGDPADKRELVLLLLFLAAAVLIRAPGLGTWGLAVDEFYFTRAVSFVMEHGIPAFPEGGYYVRGLGLQYLTAPLLYIIPDRELAVRIVPLVFGALTIPLFFRFCRKFLGVGEAAVCTLLLLLSSWHIEFSRFARMYAPFQFFFILFLYCVHAGYIENSSRYRLAAWLVAIISVFVYEGSIFPALLLGALPFLTDVARDRRGLLLFYAAVIGLVALNLAVHNVDYRDLGVPQETLVRTPSSAATDPVGSTFALPDLALLAYTWRTWWGRAALGSFAALGIWLAVRSTRGPQRSGIAQPWLTVALAMLSLLAVFHQYALLAMLGVIFALNRRGGRDAVRKHLPSWGLYLLATAGFWIAVAGQTQNLDRIRHFLVGYPPLAYAVLYPFLQVTPLWLLFLLGVLLLSIVRRLLFPNRGDDAFPVATLLICLLLTAAFNTRYRETRYSFFYFPLFLLVALGEVRAIRLQLARRVPAQLARGFAAVLLVVPLAAFVLTEDFHLHHVMDVAAPDLNFRTGRYSQFAPHWYRRFDFGTTAAAVEGDYATGDVVVVEEVANSEYLRVPFRVYVDRETGRFGGIARAAGSRELWSGRPLLSTQAQIAAQVPLNHQNSLWLIGVGWGPDNGASDLEPRYQAMADSAGLHLELVHVGLDGRTGVLRIRRPSTTDRS